MNDNEKKINNTLEKKTPRKIELVQKPEIKGLAAIKEAERRMKLDETVEENLSAGLETNKTFVKKDKKISNKRVLTIKLVENKINEIIEGNPEYNVSEEQAQQATKELEAEMAPFAKKIYSNLASLNKNVLIEHLADNPVSPDKSEIINIATGECAINITSEAYDNVVSFSDNGFLIQLDNKKQLPPDTKLNNEACLYNLISPAGSVLPQKLNYHSALTILEEQAEAYQQKLKEGFDSINGQKHDNKPSKISDGVKDIIYTSGMSTDELKAWLDKTPEERKKIIDSLDFDSADNSTEREEKIIPTVENIVDEKFLYKDTLPEQFEANKAWSRNENGELKENLKDYAESYQQMIETNKEKLEKAHSYVREKFQETMNKIGIVPNVYGQSDTWIDWDLAKQKFLFSNPEKSNKNYNLADPIDEKSEDILNDILNRHVGWEVLGVVKSNESFLDTLNKDKDSYNKISSLIEEGLKDGRLASYKLAELGKLFAENKETEEELSEAGNDNEPSLVTVENEEANLESESAFVNPFNEKVSKYAESIGIKPEELASNPEFLNLSPEQQQFALETLRRTSFAKARVEAHQTFAEEKAGKKWWQVGFAMNQNFHKERHKIEAIKNIESRGLEGYGETELAWLTEVIKNGPEVKVNDTGEIIVNCLHDSGFSDEQKELIAKYNEEARDYIEKPKTKKSDIYNDTKDLNKLKRELLKNCVNDEEREQLIYNLNESEKNIQLLKFLSANKETEEMIQQMASRSLTGRFDKAKAMAGAQKDKAGYSALGFVLRTGSKVALANSAYVASALTYSTAPIVAAMVGGLRGYNQGKKSLAENEELAQLGVKDKSATAKSLNLAVGENSLKNKLDNLVDKLEKLKNESASEEVIKKVEESLSARIYYTQGQMNNESVSYGSTDDRGANYLELTNSLVKANSIIWEKSDLLIGSDNYYQTSKDTKNLTRQTNLYKGIDLFNKIPNTSDPKYREWAQDKERFEELQKLSTEDRLASFLNYKEDAQSRKELKFVLTKAATGAVMGASFAAVGSYVAEHLGVSSWLNDKAHDISKWMGGKFHSGKNLTEVDATTGADRMVKTGVTDNTENVVTKTVPTVSAKHIIEHHNVEVRHAAEPIKEFKTPVAKLDVSDLKIKTPIGPETIPVQTPVAPIETAPIITPAANVMEAPVVPPATGPVAQEIIDGKKAADVIKNVINVNNNAAKIAEGVYSNNANFRTEADFLKQVSEINGGTKLSADEQLEAKSIYDSFKQNNDYNILRKRLVSFEGKVASAHTEVVATPETITPQTPVAPIETAPVVTPASNIVETTPVVPSVTEPVSQEVIDAQKAAGVVKNIVNIDNKAVKLVDGVYNNNPALRTEEAFVKQLSTDNGGAKLAPDEEAYARSAWKSFQENKDYNGFKRRIISLEEGINNRVGSNAQAIVETPNIEKPFIADKISIAEELHTKPEALEQVGSDLVYKGAGKSNIVFDLKAGGIKEAVDTSGKKIPKEFITELMNGNKLSKFTRGGGLEKIFTSWNKLGSNDKLAYESLNWFNKKTMTPEDLVNQIKSLYQVKTDNLFIDADNKRFIMSDGRTFDMTLKGIKKLVAYLPKK